MGKKERIILATKTHHIDKLYKKVWRRFIDDIFVLFQGTESELNEFMELLNSLFPSIKVTASFDFVKRKVEFLDILVKID